VKHKQMTTTELHERMAQPLCEHCAKLKEEHLAVMAESGMEYRCYNKHTNGDFTQFTPKED